MIQHDVLNIPGWDEVWLFFGARIESNFCLLDIETKSNDF